MPFDFREAMRAMFAAIVLSAVAFGVVIMIARGAHARPGPQYAGAAPAVKEWFESRRNRHGDYCCNEADGHPFFGRYDMNADGSVTIWAGTGAIRLPPHMLVEGPNPTGHAVWWYDDSGSSRTDYCFAPGPLS